MKLNSVYTCSYKNVVTHIKQTDQVRTKVRELPSIPAGANPFHYDCFSMGTDLPRGWLVMHAGYDDNTGFEDMYLVNQTTGQRINIEFEAMEPTYEASVYIADSHAVEAGQIYCWIRDNEKVNWVPYMKSLMTYSDFDKDRSIPLYVAVGNHFVRMDIIVDDDKRAEWILTYETEAIALKQLNYHLDGYKTTYSELRPSVHK